MAIGPVGSNDGDDDRESTVSAGNPQWTGRLH